MREHRYIHTISYQEDKCRRCQQAFERKSLLLSHLKTCFRSARTKNGSIDESPYMYNMNGDAENNNDVVMKGVIKAELRAIKTELFACNKNNEHKEEDEMEEGKLVIDTAPSGDNNVPAGDNTPKRVTTPVRENAPALVMSSTTPTLVMKTTPADAPPIEEVA